MQYRKQESKIHGHRAQGARISWIFCACVTCVVQVFHAAAQPIFSLQASLHHFQFFNFASVQVAELLEWKESDCPMYVPAENLQFVSNFDSEQAASIKNCSKVKQLFDCIFAEHITFAATAALV